MKTVIGYKPSGSRTHRWIGIFVEGQPDAMRSRCGLNTRLKYIRVPKFPQTQPTCTKCNYAGYKPRADSLPAKFSK